MNTSKYVYIHSYIHTRKYVYNSFIHTRKYLYIHLHIHTREYLHIHSYIRTFIRTHTHIMCMYAYRFYFGFRHVRELPAARGHCLLVPISDEQGLYPGHLLLSCGCDLAGLCPSGCCHLSPRGSRYPNNLLPNDLILLPNHLILLPII